MQVRKHGSEGSTLALKPRGYLPLDIKKESSDVNELHLPSLVLETYPLRSTRNWNSSAVWKVARSPPGNFLHSCLAVLKFTYI